MTLKEAIRKNMDEYGNPEDASLFGNHEYLIGFLNPHDLIMDQTSFDIHEGETESDLQELWDEFRKENDITEDDVEYVARYPLEKTETKDKTGMERSMKELMEQALAYSEYYKQVPWEHIKAQFPNHGANGLFAINPMDGEDYVDFTEDTTWEEMVEVHNRGWLFAVCIKDDKTEDNGTLPEGTTGNATNP